MPELFWPDRWLEGRAQMIEIAPTVPAHALQLTASVTLRPATGVWVQVAWR